MVLSKVIDLICWSIWHVQRIFFYRICKWDVLKY